MSLRHDVVHVTRSLARQPSVSMVSVVTLALGVGLNSAVFAVAYGVLWRPLPFPDADRLVTIATRYHQNPDAGGVAFDQFDAWTDRLRTADLAGYQSRERGPRGAGVTRLASVVIVTRDFFTILGVAAVQGSPPRWRLVAREWSSAPAWLACSSHSWDARPSGTPSRSANSHMRWPASCLPRSHSRPLPWTRGWGYLR